ncbi:MAG: ABC transporter permease, partial [Clostridia bacterium]|nr:ABC transporter permease [Clostridia bacterium]
VPIYSGADEQFNYGVATDLRSVSNIFELNFLKAMPLRTNEIVNSVFVSDEFAKENNSYVGQTITLTILGTQKEFTIVGISQYKLLGEYSLMIDISTLVSLIVKNSTTEMLLGDEFIPATKIFVDVDGDVTEAMDKILSSDDYENAILSRITSEDTEERSLFASASKTIVLLIIMLTVIFTFAVIYVCFAVLTAQRKEENALFYAAGARSYMLNTLSAAEMLIYWIVGGCIGIALSYAIAKLYVLVGNFHYCQGNIETWTIFASLGITLAAAEGSMGIFILTDRIRKNKEKKHIVKKEFKAGIQLAAAMFGVAVLLTGLSFIENATAKKICAIAGVFLLCVTVFFGTKQTFPKIAKKMSENKKLSVTWRYAIKNASKVDSLASTSSVVALLIVVMFAVSVVYAYSAKSVVHDTNYFVGDYLVENLTESGINSLYDSENIDAVYGVFFDTANRVDDDFTYIMISANSVDAIAPHLHFDTMPEGNEVYMCKELALHAGLEMGDTIEVTMRGLQYDFVYAGNIAAGGSRVFFNYVDMGFAPTCYEVIGANGVSAETVKDSIASALVFENATIVPATALTKEAVDVAERYVVCIEFIATFLLIFSLVGIIDNIVSSYRSRRDEFACFMSAGMNNKNIKNLKASEIAFACIFAVVVACICSGLTFACIHQIIRAFSDNMFYVF